MTNEEPEYESEGWAVSSSSGDASFGSSTVGCTSGGLSWWPNDSWTRPAEHHYYYPVNQRPKCRACDGTDHVDLIACPKVRSIEYFDDGSLRRIEFIRP